MDLISVVVPIYNVENYLTKCINSICNQTYKNLQIILVDDGSTDSSGILCDNASKIDNRIIVIHKKNGGLSDARNYGIDISLGKYITFIDSDDYISTDYIEYLYTLITRNESQISICGFIKTKYENDCTRIKEPIEECFDNDVALREMLYARKYSTSAWGKLYLTDFFSDVRYPVGKFAEDMFTTYKVLKKANKISYGNQICYYYLRRNGSILVSQFSEKNMDVIDGLLQLRQDIPLKQHGIEKAFASQMIECIAAMFERKPKNQDILKLGVWRLFKEYRRSVIFDKNATNRVRAYALLSYLGVSFTIYIISKYYNIKWHTENDKK